MNPFLINEFKLRVVFETFKLLPTPLALSATAKCRHAILSISNVSMHPTFVVKGKQRTMKNLIIILFLFAAHLTFGQNFTDTIYFKSGEVRPVQIWKESNTSIKFNYSYRGGKTKTAVARKSMINKFTIGDKANSVASDYESTRQRSTEKTVTTTEDKVAGGVFVAVLIAVPTALLITLIAILN